MMPNSSQSFCFTFWSFFLKRFIKPSHLQTNFSLRFMRRGWGSVDYHSGGRLAAPSAFWTSCVENSPERHACGWWWGWRWCRGIDLILIGPWKEHDLTAFSWEYIWVLSTVCSPSLLPFSILRRTLSPCLSLFDTQCLWPLQKALNVSLMTLWIPG